MKRMIVVSGAVAMCWCSMNVVRAEEAPAAPAVAAPAPDTKAEREAFAQQNRLEQVKKQIAERQAQVEKMTKALAETKDEEMKPMLEKQIEMGRKHVALLQEAQTAMGAQNREQMEKIQTQIRDLNDAWNGTGEATARMEMERARAKKIMGENPGPDLKAAWDTYNTACEATLAAVLKKAALEKEIRELKMKQSEAQEKFRQQVKAAQQKDKGNREPKPEAR